MNINTIIFLPSPSSLCPTSKESLQNGKDRTSSFKEASFSPNSNPNFCHPKGTEKPNKAGLGEKKVQPIFEEQFSKSTLFAQTGSLLNRHSTDSGFWQPPAQVIGNHNKSSCLGLFPLSSGKYTETNLVLKKKVI